MLKSKFNVIKSGKYLYNIKVHQTLAINENVEEFNYSIQEKVFLKWVNYKKTKYSNYYNNIKK